jgi:type IV pilus assembly protein PilM
MPGGIFTAIDIGSDAVKVVSARQMRGGRPVIVGAGSASVSDFDRNAEDYPAQVSAAINRVLKKNNIPLGRTIVGLPGRGSMVRYHSVPIVPPWKLKMLMQFEVEEQMSAVGGSESVAYDYSILRLPGFDEGQFPLLLALAQNPVIESRMAICLGGARRCDDVSLQCLGAFNFFRLSPQCRDEELSVLLDIGAEETHLTLQEGSTLFFARTFSTGGKQVTARLQKQMKLLGPEAEEFKRREARIIAREEEDFFVAETLAASQACRAEMSILATNVQSSLRFFATQFKLEAPRPQKVFLTGGGSLLQGLSEALAETLKCGVELFDPAGAVEVSPKAEEAFVGTDAHFLSAAAGMALARAGRGFSVSLLPAKIKEKREFWSRRIFACYAAAAAFMLLIVTGLNGCPYYEGWRGASHGSELARQWDSRVTEAKNEHKKLADLRKQNEETWDKLQALKVRKASGRDLLTCLQLLQETAPDNVFYTNFSTSGKIEDDLENAGAAKVVTSTKDEDTLQSNRYFLVHGYLVGAADDQDATKQMTALADKLQTLEFFSKVEIMRQATLPNKSQELEEAGKIKLFNEEESVVVAQPDKSKTAISFIFQCGISK